MRVSFKIRNLILGHNYEKQDLQAALELAMSQNDEESHWLNRLFPTLGNDPILVFEVEGSPRALFYAARLQGYVNHPAIETAAFLGYSPAQTCMALVSDDKLKWTLAAAKQYDPQGLYLLGLHHLEQSNMDKARTALVLAATDGHVDALLALGPLLNTNDHVAFWFSRMIILVKKHYSAFRPVFVETMMKWMCNFVKVQEDSFEFSVGRLVGQYKSSIASVDGFIVQLDPKAVESKMFKAVRKAIHAFLLVGIRCHLCKDLRRFLANMIWELRYEWISWKQVLLKKIKI
jgi:hypothetical protein